MRHFMARLLKPLRSQFGYSLASKSRQPKHRLPTTSAFELLECRAMLAAGVTPTFSVTNDWGSGYQAEIKLANGQSTSVSNWRLEFDLAANITSIWDAKIVSHVGNHYVVSGATWNSNLPAGGSISFGYVASPGGSPKGPANYLLNGLPLDGSTPPASITASIDDVMLSEGKSGSANANFTVKLSSAPTTPVTLKYATANGSATAGSDFQSAASTLTFAAGQTQATISVPVTGDTLVESDENFYIDLSAATGAKLSKSRGTATIKNDDVLPASGDFKFQVGDNWGSGFTGQITLRNSGTTTINDWVLEFNFNGQISDIWNAKVVSHVGTRYVVQNAGYNGVLAAGASTSFGFTASPGGSVVAPTNYLLRAANGGSGTPGTNRPPVATADTAFTTPGVAVPISVLANDTDPDGDALTLVSASVAAQGTVVVNANQTITYTPKAGFVGADTFTYIVRDAQGATATGNVSVTVAATTPASNWPAQVFAPYVDMGLYPTYDLVAAARTSGIRYFTLAFVVADPTGKPAWGGYSEYGLGTAYDAALRTQLAGVRALGGDAMVSFGGASGRELAEVITDVNALAKAYQSVIDAYGLTRIDFDIEGAAAAERASIDRRNQAIAILEQNAAAAGKKLDVWYTLPVLPTGLVADGLNIVQSAVKYGAVLGGVNIMAMDYGDSAAPNPSGKMGDYAIQAANSLFTQLKTIYGSSKTDAQLWKMVGLTPMIGMNDVTSEVFDQQEAREVLAFAQQKGIGRISFWSLNRDQQNAAGKLNYVDLKSSSLLQQPFEFSTIFLPFTK